MPDLDRLRAELEALIEARCRARLRGYYMVAWLYTLQIDQIAAQLAAVMEMEQILDLL